MLTIQVHVIVHDADADVFIMLIMILDRNNSYNITNNCEYCPGPSLTVSHNIEILMSGFKFLNLSGTVNYVTKSLSTSPSLSLSLSLSLSFSVTE